VSLRIGQLTALKAFDGFSAVFFAESVIKRLIALCVGCACSNELAVEINYFVDKAESLGFMFYLIEVTGKTVLVL